MGATLLYHDTVRTGDFVNEVNTELNRAADRKSTRLNSSHITISYAVFCLKKNNIKHYIRYMIKYKCLGIQSTETMI